MNIALYHNLPSGGARRAMVEMVKGLVARDHTVDEYCPETADRSFQPLNGIVRRTVVLPFRPRGVVRTRLPLLTPYINTTRLACDLQTLAALGAEAACCIDRQDYDLVFTHDCQFVLVPDIHRFLQIPTVHYFHAGTSASVKTDEDHLTFAGFVNHAKYLYYAPARRAFPWLRFRQAKRNLQSADRVLTNSYFAANELCKAFGVSSQVCYLGVDTEQFHPLGFQRESFVLSVGAVHYHKGYRFLIQALAKLPVRQRPSLMIAANSAESTELHIIQTLAANLGVKLKIQNIVSASDMADIYNQASAFVYAPLREPWGLAAVEAMACGTPVVAVGEGGITESVVDGETGLLTNRETEAFAAALNCVLSDPVLAKRLGVGGVAHVCSRFAWGDTVDQLEFHFRDIIRTCTPS